jgi:hypothetical protein
MRNPTAFLKEEYDALVKDGWIGSLVCRALACLVRVDGEVLCSAPTTTLA